MADATTGNIAGRTRREPMIDLAEVERTYREARRRADEAFWAIQTLRASRQRADAEAAAACEGLLVRAGNDKDRAVRAAAAGVRRQRSALRRSADVLACSLLELLERLVGVDADALGFSEDADAFVLVAIEGRSTLAERHLAVARAEALLEELLDVAKAAVPDGS